MAETVEIDGSEGEGGGQILRTSLALSIITRTPIRLRKIRAKRTKPGLRRQHLAAVRAAEAISGAELDGDAVGSTDLWFSPGELRPGDHRIAIGTAGSTTLVLQTVIWPLLLADAPSQLVIEGGTHNPMAPTFEFLDRTFFPRVRQMGVVAEIRLERHGFYPAGGGRLRVTLRPSTLSPHSWMERGSAEGMEAQALVANLPLTIASRELNAASDGLDELPNAGTPRRVDSPGPGNVLLLEASFESGCTVVSAVGRKGTLAEDVANEAVKDMRRFLATGAPICEHLADQLLIPMALAHGGSFVTGPPTLHTRTNADIIDRFLPVKTTMTPLDDHRWLVEVLRS